MSTPEPSWAEQSANAERIRAEAEILREDARAERDRRNLLDAAKIAKAEAAAAKIKRQQQEEAEEAERQRRRREDEERAERERLAEVARRDERAAKAVKAFSTACFLFAMPLQLLAFWEPGRPWMLLGPIVLESGAWVMMRQAEAGIIARRMVWHYLAGAALAALFAAVVNIWHGATQHHIGLDFGLVGAFCSLGGPAVWAIHEFGARAKTGKATRSERKIAEAKAREAEALTARKRDELEARRKADAERREEARQREEARRKAEAERIAAQDSQRAELFPAVWERYKQILAVHPLGSISRDRAWADAMRAVQHPEVWERYELLVSAGPANVKPGELWEVAWKSVHGLPVGQTAETLAADLAARKAVEDVLAGAGVDPFALAVDNFLADLFPGPGGGEESGGGARLGKGGGGPSQGPTTLDGKGRRGSDDGDDRPLTEAELAAVRELADELGGAHLLSSKKVRERVGCRNSRAVRLRDAVKAERGVQQ